MPNSLLYKYIIVPASVTAILVGGGLFIAGMSNPSQGKPASSKSEKQTNRSAVELISVADTSRDTSLLSVNGTVTPQSEVTLRAETSGKVTSLPVSENNQISAGKLIAQVENTRQENALKEARSAVNSTQAALQKAKEGARKEDIAAAQTQLENAKRLLQESRRSTVDSIQAAFTTGDTAIHSQTDSLFDDPRSNTPELKYQFYSSQLENDIEFERIKIRSKLNTWQETLEDLDTDSNLESAIDQSQEILRQIRSYLAMLGDGISRMNATANVSKETIANLKNNVQAARTSTNNTLNSLASTQTNLQSQKNSVKQAQRNYEQVTAETRSEDIEQTQASYEQAQAQLETARSNLRDTQITAPISGVLRSVKVEKGDFVSSGQTIATLASYQSKEVEVFVTSQEASNLSVGGEATIAGRTEGRISEIATTIEDNTNKIKVTIIPVAGTQKLTLGESVPVTLKRSATKSGTVRVPLSAINIGAEGARVFTVSSDNTLAPHPVSTGTIYGNKVTITGGLENIEKIVKDARGLRPGETVTITAE